MSERKQPKAEPQAEERAKRPESTTIERPGGGLDFSKLDLSVETVDERISPSETNVFDK
jgi:hypothetical protein